MNEIQSISSSLKNGIDALKELNNVIYPNSINKIQNEIFFLARINKSKNLIIGNPGPVARTFQGENYENDEFKVCPLSEFNTAVMRETFQWTNPCAVGSRTSFGTGDRIGAATPGHIRAIKDHDIFPVLAQQSMREMGRTNRTPRQVIDDTVWGVFESGWKNGYGADADHIKKPEEAVECFKLGYTMFTIDACENINIRGHSMSDKEVVKEFHKLSGSGSLRENYLTKTIYFKDELAELTFNITEVSLARAAVTNMGAIIHFKQVYDALKKAAKDKTFDFEVSVDETSIPTSPEEHYFIASELKRLGVKFASLAPRFIGEFQKGIDYIGDVKKFEKEFAAHALIARNMGNYKISVHSGSDKFSIFPIVGKYTNGFFHVKTAGTSWLEAVRVIAKNDPDLYREMHKHALERFEEDRQSYHVTTNLGAIQDINKLKDNELPALLDKNDSRQLIHITYGSILTAMDRKKKLKFRERFYRNLFDHEEDHYRFLEKHIGKHVELLKLD
ncbi:MAG: tagaturonate epimerase family protein [bacterium]